MSAAPFISVVMPVYNVEAYVADAIRSVLAQTYAHFELIIVDDGGQDRSIEICRSFSDPRIRIISQANRGLAGARNTGIAAARGAYVALLDSDDLWHPKKLMLHVIHLEANSHIDVSYAGSRMINADGSPLKVAMRPRLTRISPAHILKRNPVGNGSAAVIRRTALARVVFAHPDIPTRPCWFDESFRQSEDIELWVRMAARYDCRFEGIDGLLTDYRIIGGALSANIARQFESWQRMMDKAERFAPRLIARHGKRALAYQLRYLARRAVQLGDGPFAASLARQAIAASPAILVSEPVKTSVTLAAATVARWMSPERFRALAAQRVGIGAAA
jgi:glycosyltransferase involved in cell wall biosynthesis